MTLKNLLTKEEQSFSSSSALWIPFPSAQTSVARSAVRYNSEPASLLVTSKNGNQMVVRLDRELPIAPGKRYRVFASAYSDTADHEFGVSVGVLSRAGILVETFQQTELTVFGRWKTVSLYFVAAESASSISVSIVSEASHLTDSGVTVVHPFIWFDDIVVAEWPEYPDNEFATLTQRHIPAYMLEMDDDDPVKPLRRFVDANTSIAEEILLATRAFDYIPAVDGVPGYERSTLVDPTFYPDETVAKRAWLPWLAQLVGVKGVSAGSSGLTPWFWLEQAISTWSGMETLIDPSSNPVWGFDDFSLERTSGVVTAVLSSQIGGSEPYFPQVGDVVEVSADDTEFNGSFSVVSSDEPTSTLTWAQDGSDHSDSSPSGGGSLRVSDTSWVEIEGANPLAFDTVGVLANLTRTKATGLKSGSRYGIKAAARAVLDGFDDTAVISTTGAVLIINTSSPHTLVAGDFIEMYDCPEPPYNLQTSVSAVLTPTSFTVNSPYGVNDPHIGESFRCWVTNKKVVLETVSQWSLKFKTTEAQTYALSLLEQAVSIAKPAGMAVQHEYTT